MGRSGALAAAAPRSGASSTPPSGARWDFSTAGLARTHPVLWVLACDDFWPARATLLPFPRPLVHLSWRVAPWPRRLASSGSYASAFLESPEFFFLPPGGCSAGELRHRNMSRRVVVAARGIVKI